MSPMPADGGPSDEHDPPPDYRPDAPDERRPASPDDRRTGGAADRAPRSGGIDDPDGIDEESSVDEELGIGEDLGIDATDDEGLLDLFVAEDPEDRTPDPIEPGSPSVENALFVLLGVLGTVAVLVSAL